MRKIRKKALLFIAVIFFPALFLSGKVYSQDSSLQITENVPTTDTISTNVQDIAGDNSIVEKDTSISENLNSAASDPETTDAKTESTPANVDEYGDSSRLISDPSYKPILRIRVETDVVVYTVSAREADRVECFLEREGVGNPMFLGAARKIQEESWELKIDIRSKIPNGTYTGFSKIYDNEGNYRTDKISFSINQPVTFDSNVIPGSLGSLAQSDSSDPAGVPRQMPAINLPVNLEDDFDRDGISNEEEKRLGTNPLQADSDRDGFLDGDEIKNGFNPLRFSPGDKRDKIIFQSPKDKGPTDETYVVENIEMKKDPENRTVYRLSGKALPNIFLTVYIYSQDPIVLTVKTDENGNWTYELDKELENGDHEIYVAMTDNSGKITAKSEPLRFVKTAEAVSIVRSAAEYELTQPPPMEKRQSNALLYATIFVTFFLGAALALVGFITSHNKKNEGIN